jgi:transcription elongation factor SPT5
VSAGGSGGMWRGPKDKFISLPVIVVKGPQKGYLGIVKDANGNLLRVELTSNNKVVTYKRSKLKWKTWVILNGIC